MAKLPPAIGPTLLVALLLGSPRARADEPAPIPQLPPPALPQVAVPIPLPPPPAPAPAPRVIWYGWEPLAAGAGITALSLALLKNDPEAGLVLGVGLSPLTTMSMHMIHGEEVKAYVSVAVSYAMIAGGGALAAKLECGPGSAKPCVANAVFAGMILGGLSAVVLDAAALAWGPPAFPPPPVKKAVLMPSLTPLPGGAAVGLGGTF